MAINRAIPFPVSLLPEMLNLAALKYANCLSTAGGPLERMEAAAVEMGGRLMNVANAWLLSEYRERKEQGTIYSSCDGTGIHRNPITARHMAISEALERWAHRTTCDGPNAADYGFDLDPTTNGMAAFPGLLSRQARAQALEEAIERYSLVAWWSGNFEAEETAATESGCRCYRILQPFPDHEVVILRRDGMANGHTVFGYGVGKNLPAARLAALLEMERSRILLARFFQNNPGFESGDLSALKDYRERRLVYFALPEGTAAFERRVGESPAGDAPPPMPKIRVDRRVEGPWSRYATVWRVLFEPPTQDYLNPHSLFFLW